MQREFVANRFVYLGGEVGTWGGERERERLGRESGADRVRYAKLLSAV